MSERHRRYDELSRTGPVHRVVLPHGETAWLVTRYQEARAALLDPRLAEIGPPFADQLDPVLNSAVNNHLLNVDGPEHRRLRRLVAAAFTRRRVEALAPRIQQLTDELLAPLVQRVQGPGFDLIAEFACPLPIAVICELLGVPRGGRAKFREWSWADVNASLIGAKAYAEAVTAFVQYLRELIAVKREQPGDDLISALVVARDGHDQLTEDELTSMVYLLLVAGHETTVNLIGNGIHQLLTQRERWQEQRSGPGLVPTAVEELLRINGPLQTTTLRVAVETFDIGDVTIESGDTVVVGLLAANRDATSWSEPGTLDLTRSPNKHLAFGHGIHLCVGAPLARLEARIALTSLLTQLPELRLAVGGGAGLAHQRTGSATGHHSADRDVSRGRVPGLSNDCPFEHAAPRSSGHPTDAHARRSLWDLTERTSGMGA
ncbi:cytochrome P450 family protein [Saccharopolyspora soli]|uniref:cytochrome P450 family protein n=1 Tax=Saccharopolyspora soli TaxID=2926618 RepID=UPI001F58280E|nr:cytochrome P450 [Saccharopolyspora soli]